ncbi:MAG: hypothetical protein LBT27_00415 [Prevotellaceae bacterium]|jgi:hypothetical protein|nr:hypothetical protein [Prevotellaceae bacterium]
MKKLKLFILLFAVAVFLTIYFVFSTTEKAVKCAASFGHETHKPEYEVHTFEYNSLTIPEFFTAIIENHLIDFYKTDSISYINFCNNNNLLPADSNNISNYFTLRILHDLFTSKTADDCSQGEILAIPYFWHWITPNPRHEIYFSETKQLLCETRPPPEFARYNSYADIDRTPYLFLSDLVTYPPKYYSSCDTFSTFGWCSEREMAFVALTKLLHYDGKVIVSGNHSWSEFMIKMNGNDTNQFYKVIIDNTFDHFDWTIVEQVDIAYWHNQPANWYNRQAQSSNESKKIRNHFANKNAMAIIEIKIVEYLQKLRR